MKNTHGAQARTAAIEATYRVGQVAHAGVSILAAAQHARRNILDGVTEPTEYPSVAAYFNGAADALTW